MQIFAMSPGTVAMFFILPSILIGYLIGSRMNIPVVGAVLGIFGWMGWIATAVIGTVRKRRLQRGPVASSAEVV